MFRYLTVISVKHALLITIIAIYRHSSDLAAAATAAATTTAADAASAAASSGGGAAGYVCGVYAPAAHYPG